MPLTFINISPVFGRLSNVAIMPDFDFVFDSQHTQW